MTLVAVVQIVVLVALAIAIVLWAMFFPYPSPLVRRFLPPRLRWPEMQIREWLKDRRFQSAFLRYFNRDPKRTPPPGKSVLAPADGIVTSADVRDGVRYLVIALSFWDMHVQRSPASGKVLDVQAHGDGFMDAEGRDFAFLREKSCPVQKRVVIATDAGKIAVRLITSLAARRIETWVQGGEQVERGQRIGRILLGSTVVLELPAATKLLVRAGDRVWAGETAIAGELSAHE
jgi:phosphatidylserine decarboxylase